MDLKLNMEKALEKFGRLHIQNLKNDDCVSTDSEMEEVVDEDCNYSKSEKIKNVGKKVEGGSEWSILTREENLEVS